MAGFVDVAELEEALEEVERLKGGLERCTKDHTDLLEAFTKAQVRYRTTLEGYELLMDPLGFYGHSMNARRMTARLNAAESICRVAKMLVSKIDAPWTKSLEQLVKRWELATQESGIRTDLDPNKEG